MSYQRNNYSNSGGSGGGWGKWIIVIILALVGVGFLDYIPSKLNPTDSEVTQQIKDGTFKGNSKKDTTITETSTDETNTSSDTTNTVDVIEDEVIENENEPLKIDEYGNVTVTSGRITSENIPDYDGKYKLISINKIDSTKSNTSFNDNDMQFPEGKIFFESKDDLGRVGEANGMITTENLPTVDRKDTKSISGVKPTGWNNQKVVSNGKSVWLYNRSHLIAWSLSGETDNSHNLMTGTRQLNASSTGMTAIESIVRDYIKETGKPVRYRVTPIFKEDELLARGVQMEAKTLLDEEININVFIFNVQDDVMIDYSDGSILTE